MNAEEQRKRLWAAIDVCRSVGGVGPADTVEAVAQGLFVLLMATRGDDLRRLGAWVPDGWTRQALFAEPRGEKSWIERSFSGLVDAAADTPSVALGSSHSPSGQPQTAQRAAARYLQIAEWVRESSCGIGRMSEEGVTHLVGVLDRYVGGAMSSLPSDCFRDALFELSRFAPRQVSTSVLPSNLCKLAGRLLDVRPGASCVDPSADWSVLVSFAQDEWRERGLGVRISATGCHEIGHALLWLMGARTGEIRGGDALRDPNVAAEEALPRLAKYDRVLTAPPAGKPRLKQSELASDRFQRFPPHLRRAVSLEALHLCHAWASLEAGGRASVIVPIGMLFRASDQPVRERLLGQDGVLAVVGLPGGLWQNTSIQTAIVVLQRDKPPTHHGRVLFVNVSRPRRRGESDLTVEESETVLSRLEEWLPNDDSAVASRVVQLEVIGDQDSDLSPSRYIDHFTAEDRQPLSELVEELRDLERDRNLAEDVMDGLLESLQERESDE